MRTVTLKNGVEMSREDWAKRITDSWQQSIDSILETGFNLRDAKDSLAHGEFQKMIKAELPFAERTAQRLMAISANPVISDATHVSHLPVAWGTLYELTKMDDKLLEAKLESGEINPATERKEIAEMLGKSKASKAEKAGVVKESNDESQSLPEDAKRALEECADWLCTKAAEDDMPIATLIGWFSEFKSAQLVEMLRASVPKKIEKPMAPIVEKQPKPKTPRKPKAPKAQPGAEA